MSAAADNKTITLTTVNGALRGMSHHETAEFAKHVASLTPAERVAFLMAYRKYDDSDDESDSDSESDSGSESDCDDECEDCGSNYAAEWSRNCQICDKKLCSDCASGCCGTNSDPGFCCDSHICFTCESQNPEWRCDECAVDNAKFMAAEAQRQAAVAAERAAEDAEVAASGKTSD